MIHSRLGLVEKTDDSLNVTCTLSSSFFKKHFRGSISMIIVRFYYKEVNMPVKIILFDGHCHFCSSTVQFIVKRDPNAHFKFAPLQSDVGKKLKKALHIPASDDSFILIQQNQHDTQSTAALKVAKYLSGGWKLFYIFIIIPRPIRNFIYRIIAKNRYKWFGKRDACFIPTEEIRQRFL